MVYVNNYQSSELNRNTTHTLFKYAILLFLVQKVVAAVFGMHLKLFLLVTPQIPPISSFLRQCMCDGGSERFSESPVHAYLVIVGLGRVRDSREGSRDTWRGRCYLIPQRHTCGWTPLLKRLRGSQARIRS